MLAPYDLLRFVARSRRPRPCVAPASFIADSRGVAALEFALTIPFMTLLLMGVFDFGSVAYETMEVNAAATAGVQACVAQIQSSSSCSNTTITTAEQNATNLGANVTTSGTKNGLTGPTYNFSGKVNTVSSGGKTTSTLIAASATCTGACSSAGTYAVAYAQITYRPLLSWSQLVLPSTISATAAVRYQ